MDGERDGGLVDDADSQDGFRIGLAGKAAGMGSHALTESDDSDIVLA